MRVHHLNCGTMRPLGGSLLDGQPGWRRRAELVCHCLLLETDAGLVLVETGVGSQSSSRPDEWLGRQFRLACAPTLDGEESAVVQVERLGHDASDVRHIVLTHLDLDHAGGLADFPEATVHVYADELSAMRDPHGQAERARYRAPQFAHRPSFRPYQTAGEPWFGFEAVRELDGLSGTVALVPLTGHSRGHAGVAVDTGDGWLLHAGGSYFFRGEVDPVAPHCPPGVRVFESLVQSGRRDRLANQQRLRELVAAHGSEVAVFSAHDAVEYRRLAGLPTERNAS
jgi:glyoxylase-like metal-dependent hydrolase (beta-lactamase superfamily II)